MTVNWNSALYQYEVKEKIGNQTFLMAFQKDENDIGDTLYFNIYMTLYNKRKHTDYNESHVLWTGQNPIATAIVARKAFLELENYVLNFYHREKIFIYCTWLDNKRKQLYYKFLSKHGYTLGYLNGVYCLYKKIERLTK